MHYSHGGPLDIEASVYHRRSRDRYHLRRTGFALCIYIRSRVLLPLQSGQAVPVSHHVQFAPFGSMSNLLLSVCLSIFSFLVAVAPAFLGGISERSIPYHILLGPVVYLSGLGTRVHCFFSVLRACYRNQITPSAGRVGRLHFLALGGGGGCWSGACINVWDLVYVRRLGQYCGYVQVLEWHACIPTSCSFVPHVCSDCWQNRA